MRLRGKMLVSTFIFICPHGIGTAGNSAERQQNYQPSRSEPRVRQNPRVPPGVLAKAFSRKDERERGGP